MASYMIDVPAFATYTVDADSEEQAVAVLWTILPHDGELQPSSPPRVPNISIGLDENTWEVNKV